MGRCFNQLTEQDRRIIDVGLKENLPIAEIARLCNKSWVTIYREIKRGTVYVVQKNNSETKPMYRYDYAQREADIRKHNCGAKAQIDKNIDDVGLIVGLIKKHKWSPDIAIGFARRHNLIESSICKDTIYHYIDAGLVNLTRWELPHKRAYRKKINQTYRKAHKNILAPSIEDRPAEIETRETFGHWEGDLIVGERGTHTVVLTLVERKTRFCITRLLPNKERLTILAAIDGIERELGRFFTCIFKTVTFDNGSEFSQYKDLERSFIYPDQKRFSIYYAHAYASCERGTNENTNRMLRRYGFTKGTNLGLISKSEAQQITAEVNFSPRPQFNYESSREKFIQEIRALGLIRLKSIGA